MNIPHKRYQIFILFFFTLLFTLVYPSYHTAEHTFVLPRYQTDSSNVRENKSPQDFSYDKTWGNSNFNQSYAHKDHFDKYTTDDFKHHFTTQEYTENQILDERCLYMFDEFVKFAQTYSSYKYTIQQIHAQLKNLNCLQKAYYIAQGSYCTGLQNRIHYLYNQLNTITPPQHTDLIKPITYDRSITTFSEQQSEYKILEPIYRAYTPALFHAISKRIDAYKTITSTDPAHPHTRKSYNINNNVKQLLYEHGYDTKPFTECSGNPLHHAIHQESLDILERIDCLSPNSILYDHQDVLIDFTVAMVDYNHEGLIDKAMTIGDLCWTLLDYGQAVAEGVALGIYSAVEDILTNPIEATICIVAGKQVLAYQLCKVLYNVTDIGLTALTNFDHATEKWNKYAAPLNNIIDAINKKEISLRDAIKGGTAFVVGLKAQSRLLGGLGKFCNTIKHKSINFAKNSSLSNPQEYLTTPEGLLFKATSQSSKLKQSGQTVTAKIVKSTVDSKVIKNVKNDKSIAKYNMSTSTLAGKNIIRSVENLKANILKHEGHIFSEDHLRKGIMVLGKSKATIMDSLYDVILLVDKKGLLQEGSNQLRVMINGINNVEIRCHIRGGEVVSINAFISEFGRVFGNFVDATKV